MSKKEEFVLGFIFGVIVTASFVIILLQFKK